MPGTRPGDTRAVQLTAIMPQLMAVAAKLTALFAHFVAIADNFTVGGMQPGVTLGGVAMSLGQGRCQREERGGQQKLAHGILLQTGSLACDHT